MESFVSLNLTNNITKEIRTDLIEKVEQFHLVPVKFSYS